jgi:flagellar biosynthetic protein FlhB
MRLRGHVARSTDLTAMLVVGAGLCAIGFWGGGVIEAVKAMLAASLGGSAPADMGQTRAMAWSHACNVLWACAPIAAAMLVVAVAANLLQVGAVVSAQAIAPRLERVSPHAAMARLVGADALASLVLSLAKVAAVLGILWATVMGMLPRLSRAAALAPEALGDEAWSLAEAMCWRVGAALLAIGAVHYAFRRWQYERDLRMTRRERLDDLRQSQSPRRRRAAGGASGEATRSEATERI